MSRLYGRSYDAYQVSKYLEDFNIPREKNNNNKISLDELVESTSILDLYLPENAIDYLINCPIHVVKSPFIPRNMSILPNDKEDATIYFKGFNFKEENKRELIFFLGTVLSIINPDKLPGEYDFPCEYGDIFPLLLEYIYLKENEKENEFSLKHLNEVKWNGKKYIKSYNAYQRYLISDKNRDFYYMNDIDYNKRNEENKNIEKQFLSATLNTIVPLSSMDGLLQIVDKINTKEEYKDIVKLLFDNKNNDRSEILKEMGIESFGLKRLRKEIDTYGVRK